MTKSVSNVRMERLRVDEPFGSYISGYILWNHMIRLQAHSLSCGSLPNSCCCVVWHLRRNYRPRNVWRPLESHNVEMLRDKGTTREDPESLLPSHTAIEINSPGKVLGVRRLSVSENCGRPSFRQRLYLSASRTREFSISVRA